MSDKSNNIKHMKHIVKTIFAAVFLLAAHFVVSGQEVWSLERCITYALDANFSVQQAEANVKVAILAEKQAKASRLPNVSVNSSLGEQFGRTIDPTTNQFNTTGIGYNTISLNAGLPVFQGGRIIHGIKQAQWDSRASKADADQTSNNLALQVASAYLNVLLTQEQLESASRRVEQSRRQLDVTAKLIDAGTVPQADRYNIEAQIARDEQLAVGAQNSVDLALLALKQLLQLEPDYDLQIERPTVTIPADVNPDGYTLPDVYTAALETQPSIKSAGFRIKSAEEGITLAKADYLPSLSLFASLSTNYSTQARDFTKGTVRETVLTDPVTVIIDGTTPVTIQQEIAILEYPKTPYFTQVDQNFGQGFGVQLSVPLYQNGRVRLNVERARLGLLTAQLQENQVRQQLKNDIQTAIANARSARKQLDAAQKTLNATQAAFFNVEKRHSLGAVNSLELTTARTNVDNAENDLIVARYDYLFKLKIIDFYLGKELRL